MELRVQLVSGQEQRLVRCGSTDSPLDLSGGGAIRNDDDGAVPMADDADDLAKSVQIGDADESRPARGDHCLSCGPLNRLLNSLRACESIISAPAAADDASQARRRSPVRAASILIFAAVSARCAALRNSACAERNSSGGTMAASAVVACAAPRWIADRAKGEEPTS